MPGYRAGEGPERTKRGRSGLERVLAPGGPAASGCLGAGLWLMATRDIRFILHMDCASRVGVCQRGEMAVSVTAAASSWYGYTAGQHQ